LEKELEDGIPEISAERARFLKATLRRGILTSRASIKWCDETAGSHSDLKWVDEDELDDVRTYWNNTWG